MSEQTDREDYLEKVAQEVEDWPDWKKREISPSRYASFECCLNYAGNEYDNTFRMIVGHHPYCPKITEFVDKQSLHQRIDSLYKNADKRAAELEAQNEKFRNIIENLQSDCESEYLGRVDAERKTEALREALERLLANRQHATLEYFAAINNAKQVLEETE